MHNNYQFRELKDNESFEPSLLAKNVPFTQAKFYGDWQKFFKRTVKRYVVTKKGETVAYFQLIKYPLISNKNYLYIPYGPITKDLSDEFLKELKTELTKIAKQMNAVFVRLDFISPRVDLDVSRPTLAQTFKIAPSYTYHSAYFQPRVEWFLKLDKKEDGLYEAMHENTRYSIRLAERKQAITEIVTNDFNKYLEPFYELMTITSKRNGFSLHPKEYYRSVFQNLNSENAFLAIARFGEKILAIDLIIIYDKVANYVFACSSNEERNRAPTYSAIWKAIKYSKELGCDYFNFGGISTDDQPNKGWEGLTSFKKKFGGEEIRRSSFYDVVVNPMIYFLYNSRKLIKHFFKI